MALSFDATYYLNARPDVFHAFVATAGATGKTWPEFAEEHYNTFGRFEGANPNATFNTDEYLAANPDVAAAGVNPFTHYLHFGAAEGRAPSDSFPSFASFDYETYLAANPDLGAAGIDTPNEAYAHFVIFGQFEDRPGAPAVDTGVPGLAYSLTAGIDTVVGTKNNDTISAIETSAVQVLGGLDSIDGGAGRDTFNIQDTATVAGTQLALPAGFSVKNVEVINVSTNGGVDLNLTSAAGLEKLTTQAAGTANTAVTVAGTVDVSTTTAGNATTTITGGKNVAVNASLTGAGATVVTGAALESVSVKGGGAVTNIDNLGGAAGTTTSVGTTLKSVTLDNVNGATAAVKGAAIETLTIKNQDSALATTVTNGTSKALTVNVDNAGYDAAGAAVAGVTVAAGAAATAITVNASGSKSNVTVNGAAAKTLNIVGDAALVLATTTAFTKVDGAAATGNLTLGDLNAATVTVNTGAGNDSFALQATAKVAVDAGAGDDTVTLKSAVAAGSTINLGAGNDILLSAGGIVAASTATAVTVIDGGDGVDTVSASLINAANAAQFKNFENIDVSSTANLDVELLTGSTITGLTLTGGTGGGTVSNVAAGAGLVVSGANTGTSTIGVKGATAGTADAFAITFDGAAVAGAPATAANVSAGTVVLDGVEAVTVNSIGSSNTWNSITLTDDKLKTLTITGDKNLDVAFNGAVGTAGANGLSLIDGSGATGDLKIDLSTGTFGLATGGLAVMGGAGADTLISAATGGVFTGGAGNDKFDVAAAVATGVTEADAVLSTVTDFTAGDAAKLLGNATTFDATKIVLGATVTNLDLALAAAVTVANQVTWFQYGANTYIVADEGDAAFSAGDLVVKLTGLVDLSTATLDTATDYLTLA